MRKLKVKTSGYRIVSDALDSAIQSAMNKADKWCNVSLEEQQRVVLAEQVVNYFWTALEDAGAEIE